MSNLIPIERIENKIYLIRGQKVMLDFDLAKLYGVLNKRLNEQVKRNIDRFPEDFMFQLTKNETENLKSQFATSSMPAAKLNELERKYEKHDEAIHSIFDAIRQLMEPPPEKKKGRIGFVV